MQRIPSLNTLRAFEAAARLGGLTQAGVELSVTPSAVSHQVAQLERDLGVRLFERSHNRATLTPAGARFAQRIGPALAALRSAVAETGRAGQTVTLKAGVSVALRLLIPRLESFRARHPDIAVRVETTHTPSFALGPETDIALSYVRAPDGPDAALPDVVQPLAAPGLLERAGGGDIAALPLLQSAEANWDWHAWAAARGVDPSALRFTDQFDSDDAVILAATAGMGVGLVSLSMARRELTLGLLAPLADEPAVTIGHYALLTNPLISSSGRKLAAWLTEELADAAASVDAEGRPQIR